MSAQTFKDLALSEGVHRLWLLLKLAIVCAAQSQIQLLQQKGCHLAVKSFVSVQFAQLPLLVPSWL